MVEMTSVLDEILNDIKGLDPQASLVLGAGFVREEWKSLCFKRGYSIVSSAILGTRQIASTLVPESTTRFMERQARIELLRQAFQKEELRQALPLLSHHRARPSFFEKLDQTLQKGRMNFAHATEAEVISNQLIEKTGNQQKREEFFLLNRYWERLLEVRELWDEARLYEDAVQVLMHGTPKLQACYYRMEHSREKQRVEWFWSELSKKTVVRPVSSEEFLKTLSTGMDSGQSLFRKRAHSLEDAALFLLDELSLDITNQIVVIQDLPVVRRTLKRVAEQRGISLLDSRDPTLVTQSEAIKQSLLDLELCAKGFSRAAALEWLRYFHPKVREFRKKIIESAVVQGITSYRHLPELYALFQKIHERYSSRLTLEQLKNNILLSIQSHELPAWTHQVMERLFTEWESSLKQIDLNRSKKPLRYWFEQLRDKLRQINPVVDPIKNRNGLRLYRVDQCPSLLLQAETKVHFFGIENTYFEPNETQDEWFSVRDQEVLASEFGWISSLEKSTQNRSSFELWNRFSGTIFWEYEYDENGNETEGFDFTLGDPEKYPLELLSAHPRLLSSWKGIAHVPRELETLKLPDKKAEKNADGKEGAWPFSFVDAYGNCPFVAYSQHLLRLQDERDVEVELAADRFGTLLHAALEEVLKDPASVEDAFEIAWKKTPPTAWEKNDRWYQATRSHVVEILKLFIADEAAYRERSKVDLLYSEKEVEITLGQLSLRGRIDRIDDHEDGLVVMDYKTGSKRIDGHKILEEGKGLQLGLYSLAVREIFKKEVVSAQYVYLDSQKINRNYGFLFSRWNKGKKADEVDMPISTVKSNSHSLFPEEPSEIWPLLQKKVESISEQILAGKFHAIPADIKDCAQCRFEGVCGESRR